MKIIWSEDFIDDINYYIKKKKYKKIAKEDHRYNTTSAAVIALPRPCRRLVPSPIAANNADTNNRLRDQRRQHHRRQLPPKSTQPSVAIDKR